MSKFELANILNQHFPSFEKALVSEISDIAVLKEFEVGEVIMRTGQFIKSTVLIVEGSVKVYREGDDGEEFFMYEIESGGACALSIICAARSLKSELKGVVATPVKAILIPTEKLDSLTQQYRSWYHFVLETYRARFEELITVVENIAFKNMDERLEFYLLNLAEKRDTSILHITHQEIAHDLNSSREVISRLLKKMEHLGYIRMERNHIQLLR